MPKTERIAEMKDIYSYFYTKVDEFKNNSQDWRFTKQNYITKFMKYIKVEDENQIQG